MNSTSLRLLRVVIAALLVLAGCSSVDSSAASTTTASTTTASTTAASTSVTVPSTTSAAEEPSAETTSTVDNRTAEERAIDRLDLMMFDLGVAGPDLEGTANCVVERMESENIEVTGEGTAELIALFGCDEDVIARWLPTANPALPPETWSCTVESISDWINQLPIPEAEAFFEAGQPPAEFIDLTATRCDVSADELAAAF